MKYIADENGELVEVKDKNELVAQGLNEVGVNIETYFDIKLKANALKEQMEMWEYESREKIKEVFKKYNVKSFKNDHGSISYKPETLSERVDNDRLKETTVGMIVTEWFRMTDEDRRGYEQKTLYDLFTKYVPVKESLTIKVKEKSTDD